MRDITRAAAATYAAHGSVEQLYVTGAAPGMALELVDARGDVVATGTADAQGSLIFRNVAAGRGYAVVSGYPDEFAASNVVEATRPDDPPDPSFYTSQTLQAPGYGYLTTRDGTKLAYNVVLPGPPENGPYPTVVEYSGYDPANPDAPEPGMLLATALGYAAVGVNMRGTGCSGGAFDFFETLQSTDGYDLIEIVAAQPWVKHNAVGMVGISYPGITQLFVAQTNPPHLAAIAPLSVISDTGRGILRPGGILNNGFAVDWARGRQNDARPGGQPWSQKRMDEGDQVCIDNMRLRGQTPDILAKIAENAFYVPAVADPVSPITFVHKIRTPVFLAGAWQDEQTGGYFPNMLANFSGTERFHFTITNGNHVEALDPAIFTRWTEFLDLYVAREIPLVRESLPGFLLILAQQAFGTSDLRVEAPRFTDVASYEEALDRFESEPRVRILLDNGSGGTPGAPIFGTELLFDEYPIPGTEPAIYYLDAGGRLNPNPPSTTGADVYRYDPARSGDTTHDRGDLDLWGPMPEWDWKQPRRGRALAYESAPLDETLVMIGSGSVDLWIQSTAADTDLQVTLSEARPDGQEVYVQSGWLRASRRKLDPTLSSVLRPVQSHREADAAPLPPGEFVQARVELFPFGHVFRAGSRLRLIIEAPGNSRPRWKFEALPVPDGVTVHNTVARSPAHASRVALPLVRGVQVTTPLPPANAYRGQPFRDYRPFENGEE